MEQTDDRGSRDAMSTSPAQTAQQLRQLLDGVSEHGGAHLDEMQADLAQTRLLLAEAIGKLGGCFARMCEDIARQRALLQDAAGGTLPEAARAALIDCVNDVEAQTRTMVTALQFEDMTSQLIAHSERRIAGLRDMLAALGAGEHGLAEGSDAALASMHAALTHRSRALSGALCKSVGQRHLDSGDMELF
jgi:hypothetical protein